MKPNPHRPRKGECWIPCRAYLCGVVKQGDNIIASRHTDLNIPGTIVMFAVLFKCAGWISVTLTDGNKWFKSRVIKEGVYAADASIDNWLHPKLRVMAKRMINNLSSELTND